MKNLDHAILRIRPALLSKLRATAIILFLLLPLSVPLLAQQLVGGSVRAQLTLNGTWGYVLNQSQSSIPTSGWIQTRIPALPIEDGTTSVWYQRTLNVPATWTQPGRSFFLELEKAGHYSAIYVNGTMIGEHFGQFSPFEVDVTSAIIPGLNTINVYVHKADTTYVRPGVNVNQGSCPKTNPDCMGNAYRGSAPNVLERNWVGLVGDITLYWRPTENVSNVFVISSVRNSTLTADLQVSNASPVATAQAAVLDGTQVVLRLPPQPVVGGLATLEAPWGNPVLWGPSPYGHAKLYTLQTELLESGVVVDTITTRFGFREVWDDGKMTYLNGLPLWMVGDWFLKLAPKRYVNDRRAQAYQIHVWESSGLNMMESHWDDAGRPILDLADEMGYLVVAAFFCDGRPIGESEVDSVTGWTDWMASTATEWAIELRNHPSVVIWRPTDALPEGVSQGYAWPPIDANVRAADPSNRPIADGTDIDTWVENFDPDPPACDTTAGFEAKLASETKPLLTREMYGNQNVPCVLPFFDAYYDAAFTGGSIGMLSDLAYSVDSAVDPAWFSISGVGNRPTDPIPSPNWISREFTPTPLGTEFAGLFETYVQPTLLNTSPTSGDFQLSGLPADVESAFLVPDQGAAGATGVVAAQDGSGTAWFVVPQAGKYKLNYTTGGVDVVQNVVVSPPPPFEGSLTPPAPSVK
jgi:hypothetical protein